MYGVEIWGYQEYKSVETLARKYIKWVMKLDFNTPDYVIRRETKTSKIVTDTIYRALKYEEKLAKLDEKDLRKQLWKKKTHELGILNKYDVKRQEIWLELGGNEANVTEWRRAGECIQQKIKEASIIYVKDKDIRKLEKSRYAKPMLETMREDWISDRIHEYLIKNYDIQVVAKFKTGNAFNGCKYWKEKEEIKCRLCGEEEENPKHIFEECKGNRIKIPSEVALASDGSGIGFIKGVQWLIKRKEIEKKNKAM